MGCRINAWFAGLPAAVCGWKLEAVKRAGGDPPVLEGAGYNGAYTAFAGHLYAAGAGRGTLPPANVPPGSCFSPFSALPEEISLAESGHIQYNTKVRNFGFSKTCT